MAIVEVSNLPKPVAIALDWHLLQGNTSERKEVDAIVRRNGTKFGCVIESDEGLTMVGLSADKQISAHCGAAWLARASGGDAIVLVEPLPDGRLWLCAVRAGLPVQDMDLVIEPALLHERLREFLSDGGEARLCSTLENLDQAYPAVSPQSFAELVGATKPVRITRISGVNPAVFLVAATVSVALGGWYGVDNYLAKVRRLEAQAKLQQLTVMQQQQEAERVAAAKRQRLEAGQARIRQVILDKPSMATIVQAYLDVLRPKPLTIAGWTLSAYDCSQLLCTLSWARQPGGTVLSFLEAAERQGWSVDKAEGNDAVTSHQVAAEPRVSSIEDLSEDAPFRAALESQLQRAGVTGMRYELPKAEPLDKMMPAPPAPLPGEAPQTVEPLPYLVGDLTVKGGSFFELRELPDYVAHPGLSVKNLRGDMKINEWTLELNYATR